MHKRRVAPQTWDGFYQIEQTNYIIPLDCSAVVRNYDLQYESRGPVISNEHIHDISLRNIHVKNMLSRIRHADNTGLF